MILGTVLLLAAVSLFSWNQYEDWESGRSADTVLLQIKEIADSKKEELPKEPYSGEARMEETVVEIDGYEYIGYVSIPALGRELPVMAEWDYSRLKIAPCRYVGSYLTGNLVIAAHNYKTHFGSIGSLKAGEAVYFTDMNGVKYQYAVVEINTLGAAAVEEMTAGDFDLTLFTCTYGGQSRVTVRCMRM